MRGKKKQDWNGMVKAMVVLVGLLLASGTMLYMSNVWRADAGWFTAGHAITFNNFSYVIFFALLIGTVIAAIVSWLMKQFGIKSLK